MTSTVDALDLLVAKLERALRARGFTERSIRAHRRKTRELAEKYYHLTTKEPDCG